MKAENCSSNEMHGLLTVEEVARYLHISPRTVESWVRTGKIPHIKLGSAVRFDLGQIQPWLKARTVGAEVTY